MAINVKTASELLDMVGTDLGTTEWVELTQDRINLFADATGDHQWIHVDVERAKAESPFGGTVAHGYLTLSLASLFLPQLLVVEQISMGVNVGLDRVRFPSPVPAGSRLRARGELMSAEEVKGAIQTVIRITMEVKDAEKPACVADTVSRFFD